MSHCLKLSLEMTNIGRCIRTLSSVVDRSKIPHLRSQFSSPRSALLSKLRHVGRVHAPETDMRPLLPHRDLLLKSLAAGALSPPEGSSRPRFRPRTGLPRLCDDGSQHVRDGDLNGLSDIFRRVVRTSNTPEGSRWCRAVTMNALLAAAHHSSKCTVNDVLSVLTSHGIFDALTPASIGAVLDFLVKDRLRHNDVPAALRGEFMSRALDTRLSSGAYAQLIAHIPQLDLALSLLHRAVAVSVAPTISMLNDVLELCFETGDGDRARRVVSEMARRNLQPNIRTLELLLSRVEDVRSVDAVFSVARHNKTISPEAATVFIRAYHRVGMRSNVDDYIGRCFSVVDWFFEQNIGVHRHALDELISHFASVGQVEAALRAWREMRRGWLGSPSLRSRRALYASLVDRGSQRDEHICQRVLAGLSEKRIKEMHRFVLASLENDERDAKALASDSLEDRVTVLYRWAKTGRVADLWNWVEHAVEQSGGAGIDVRLMLPLLSDAGDTRNLSLKLLLKHLSSGASVCGDKDEVLRRTVNTFWRSLFLVSDEEMGHGDDDEKEIMTNDAVDGCFMGPTPEHEDSFLFENEANLLTKESLRESLADLVRVSPIRDQKVKPNMSKKT